MSTMKALSPRARVVAVLLVFIAIVTALAILYGAVGVNLGEQSDGKWLLALFGPVLALFTHMSILLFVPLCVPLIALICVGALYPQSRPVVSIGFAATWFASGWYLHGLF